MEKPRCILFTIMLSAFGVYSSEVDSPNNMYNAILHNCSVLRSLDQSKLESLKPILADCKDWATIHSMKSVEQLSDENKSNIRCLLFYETLIAFCKRLPPGQFEKYYNMIIESKINSINSACYNLSILPEKGLELQHIQDIIVDEGKCEYICKEYKAGVLMWNPLCVKSYQFNKLQLENNVLVKNNIKANGEIAKIETPSSENSLVNSPALSSQKKGALDVRIESSDANKNHIGSYNNDGKNEDISQTDESSTIQNKHSLVENEGVKVQSDANDEIVPDTESNKNDIQKKVSISGNPSIDTRDPSIETENKKIISGEKSTIHNVNPETPSNAEKDDPQSPDSKLDMNYPGPSDPQYEDGLMNIEKTAETPEKSGLESVMIPKIDEDAIPDRFKVSKASQWTPYSYDGDMDGSSNFFSYFSFTCVVFIIGYVGYHNKQKLLALLLEGRHSRRPQRGRRPNSANYHKLDCNLEEAISSSCTKNASHIIY